MAYSGQDQHKGLGRITSDPQDAYVLAGLLREFMLAVDASLVQER